MTCVRMVSARALYPACGVPDELALLRAPRAGERHCDSVCAMYRAPECDLGYLASRKHCDNVCARINYDLA